MYLFCYGTLKRGESNHDFIANCEYVGDYFTDKTFTLVVAGLPFLVKRKGVGVKGQLFKIDKDTLRAVDRLEGHPNFYRREIITVTNVDSGEDMEAYAYIHPDTFNERDFPWEYSVRREF